MGNVPKTDLERFIPEVWYWAVKSRSLRTDSDLNILFVPNPDGTPRTRENRTRTFEGIRKKGIMPSSSARKHPRRDFDLVELVDAHPEFRGTARVMKTPFWKLLRAVPGDLAAARVLVDECLTLFGLERVSMRDAIDVLIETVTTDPVKERTGLKEHYVSHFEVMLQRTTSNVPLGLDQLCLWGAMYREACLSFLPQEAELLGHYFTITLSCICEENWTRAIRNRLERYARQRVLYGEGDYCSPPESEYESNDEFWRQPSLVLRRRG